MESRVIKFRAFIDGEMIGPDALAFEEYAPLQDQLGACPTLQQYTGLKDKNGVEIYEGDKSQDGGTIVWNKDSASFCLDYPNIELQPLEDIGEWMIVSGNVHQNPELL
jgi:hypothetical protein